jgi:hypothetical protein
MPFSTSVVIANRRSLALTLPFPSAPNFRQKIEYQSCWGEGEETDYDAAQQRECEGPAHKLILGLIDPVTK